MNCPAFRSVLERTVACGGGRMMPGRPPAVLLGSPSRVLFSTTSTQAKLKDVSSSRQERITSAASEIGEMETSGGAEAAPGGSPEEKQSWWKFGGPKKMSLPPSPLAAEDSSAPRASATGSGSPFTAAPPPSIVPPGSKIINVRSLPRRPGGGGRFARPGVVAPSIGGTFTGRLGGGSGGMAGRPDGMGRRRALMPGQSSPTGKPRRRRRVMRKAGDDGDERGSRGSRKPKKLQFSTDEQAFLDARDYGQTTTYEPQVSRASLVGYGPAIASDEPAGRMESALRAMRVLGGAQPFCDALPNPDGARLRLLAGQRAFFDSALERRTTSQMLRVGGDVSAEPAAPTEPIEPKKDALQTQTPPEAIVPALPATRKAIVDAAVRGRYESPLTAAAQNVPKQYASVFELVQNYRSKNYMWSAADGRVFDEKLLSLLPGAGGPAAGRQTGKGQEKRP